MTDIHCHILPGFDDGSPSVGESVRMAEMAYASGIRRTVATPHFSALNGDIRRASEEIGRLFASLTEAVDGAGISLKLYLGAEVLCTPEIPRLLSKGLIPTVAGTDYVLTEFFFDAPTEYMDNMLDEIRSIGFIPIIAHPERYGAAQEDTTVLAGWFGKGYIIQMNKGSMLGAFGRHVRAAALRIAEAGLVHVIASDAHGSERRTPHMAEIYGFISENFSEEYAELLLDRNPGRIVRNLPVVPAD